MCPSWYKERDGMRDAPVKEISCVKKGVDVMKKSKMSFVKIILLC